MTEQKRLWIGRVLSSLAVVFLVFDAAAKLARAQSVLQATAQLGFPESSIVRVGALLLVCTAIYVIPRTRVFGALLLTGYLGGAIAAQVRVGNPVFETTFPLIIASIVWAGIALRDRRVRALIGSAA
jgi:hypothetical protein